MSDERKRDEEAEISYANGAMPDFDIERFELNPKWSANLTKWQQIRFDFRAGIDYCRETEVKELKARVCLLEKSLIKTPKELHEISEGVERMGFGTSENTRLREQLRVAVEALKFYAERMSYSMDWDTSDRGVSRRVILYSDQEEINEATIIAGKRAREALQKIEAMKGGGDEH